MSESPEKAEIGDPICIDNKFKIASIGIVTVGVYHSGKLGAHPEKEIF